MLKRLGAALSALRGSTPDGERVEPTLDPSRGAAIKDAPIDKAALAHETDLPTLSSVRQVYGGHPSRNLTPQRLAGILSSAEQFETNDYLELAEDMEEKDLHYLAVLGMRKRQVAQLPITIEAVSTDAIDVKIADFIRAWLDEGVLQLALFDVLDAIGKGYSVSELVWDTGKEWKPRRVVWRDPRWYQFDRVDGETLYRRLDGGHTEPLQPYKYLVHRFKAKSGLTIRGGFARHAAWAWMFKNYTLKDWQIFLDIYGLPFRIGKYPNNATAEEKTTLLRAVSGLGHDAAAIVPSTMTVDLVNGPAGANGSLFGDNAAFWDQQVSKAILGQTTTTDAISGGHAVSKEHNLVRGDIERGDAHEVSAAIRAQIIAPMVGFNFGWEAKVPTFRVGRPEDKDVKLAVATAFQLADRGVKVSGAEVRDLVGLRDPDPDEELLRMKRTPQVQVPPGAPGARPPKPGAGDDPDPAEDAETEEAALRADGMAPADVIDDAVAEILGGGELQAAMEEIVTPELREKIAACTSIEEATEVLAEHARKLQPTKLAELLARSMFASRAAGEAGAPLTGAG